MLSETTNVLIATARNGVATEEQLIAAAQSFFGEAAQAPQNDVNAALRSISRHFELENPRRGAYLALVCGAVIERGADPLAIAGSLTSALEPLLMAAGDLAAACVAKLPVENEYDEAALEQILSQVGPSRPEQIAAWEALEQFWQPAIAVYSRSLEARQGAGRLREVAAKLSQFHVAGHWLALMLTVLDREPILVIEPATSLGFLGRISGVVDNFQLNTLLMDAFPQSSPGATRRVTQSALDVARGLGDQESDETVASVWNLYTWLGILPDLSLPPAEEYGTNQFWVWNEGIPADIPVFEGRRVILLGPHSYPRMWPSQRMFTALPAHLECERILTGDEVDEWLRRMVTAVET